MTDQRRIVSVLILGCPGKDLGLETPTRFVRAKRRDPQCNVGLSATIDNFYAVKLWVDRLNGKACPDGGVLQVAISDESSWDSKLSAKNAKHKIKQWMSQTALHKLFVFAGHGTRSKRGEWSCADPDNGLQFDSSDNYAQDSGVLAYVDLLNLVKSSRMEDASSTPQSEIGGVTVVLDCCHSGAFAFEAEYAAQLWNTCVPMSLYLACSDEESAYEHRNGSYFIDAVFGQGNDDRWWHFLSGAFSEDYLLPEVSSTGSYLNNGVALRGSQNSVHWFSRCRAEDCRWVRVCHSDIAAKKWVEWDFSLDTVSCLAKNASRVRIQQNGQSYKCVISKEDAYPIHDLRRSMVIGKQVELRSCNPSPFSGVSGSVCSATTSSGAICEFGVRTASGQSPFASAAMTSGTTPVPGQVLNCSHAFPQQAGGAASIDERCLPHADDRREHASSGNSTKSGEVCSVLISSCWCTEDPSDPDKMLSCLAHANHKLLEDSGLEQVVYLAAESPDGLHWFSNANGSMSRWRRQNADGSPGEDVNLELYLNVRPTKDLLLALGPEERARLCSRIGDLQQPGLSIKDGEVFLSSGVASRQLEDRARLEDNLRVSTLIPGMAPTVSVQPVESVSVTEFLSRLSSSESCKSSSDFAKTLGACVQVLTGVSSDLTVWILATEVKQLLANHFKYDDAAFPEFFKNILTSYPLHQARNHVKIGAVLDAFGDSSIGHWQEMMVEQLAHEIYAKPLREVPSDQRGHLNKLIGARKCNGGVIVISARGGLYVGGAHMNSKLWDNPDDDNEELPNQLWRRNTYGAAIRRVGDRIHVCIPCDGHKRFHVDSPIGWQPRERKSRRTL